jgi:hypothetical protein
MCALNGELGGTLTSSVDFGTVEDVIENNGEKVIKITHLHVKDIIRNIVHLYGGEPLHNIVINDLDMSGLELLEYRYDIPMYLYRDATSATGYFDNVTLDGTKEGEVYVYDNDKKQWTFSRNCKLNDLTSTELEALVNPMTGTTSPARILFRNEIYDKTTGQNQDLNAYVAKINYGDTAGYRFTELTYPGDLIGAVGEVLTSILDKVKTMLGNFEYFYDLDGQFIFQKKKTISTEWLPIKTESDGQISINYDDDVAYTFNGGVLVTTFNNNPQLGNLRNDYSVWGERIGVSGKALPVHMRYAIDKKPVYYKALDGKIYTTDRETF